MKDTQGIPVSSVEIHVPTWMDERLCLMVQEIMEALCETLATKMPEGVNGVAVSYALMNLIVGTLSSAFHEGADETVKSNVFLISVGLEDMLSKCMMEMEKQIDPEIVRLIMDTEGSA